ncbi:hypothetical protein N802_10455 [Knoellia sinensis KCTC 19936]|uniref:HTH tetR-type domain-containing protein n=1 Tax=Knoellia sinensis KCTC 19936 TaxID=1385520 RepID=A0A0A0IX85_9MICO|nr:TetR/AcrR family transcriptional regulator [Knoellia sinensis]KGN29840.1 hypothetical protein N802_10455 [Knoellia sinensis KCTC 19936]
MTIRSEARLTRKERTEETNQRLLDAAFDVFCAKGYQAGTVDEVASAAGLTTGAVYSRYSGKAELVMALVERTLETRVANFRRQIELGELELGSGAARRWAEEAVGYSARPGWGSLALELRILAARDPHLAERYAAAHRRYLKGMADLIVESMEANHVAVAIEPSDLARILAAMASGMVLDGMTHRSGQPDSGLMTRGLELLLAGALTEQPPQEVGHGPT